MDQPGWEAFGKDKRFAMIGLSLDLRGPAIRQAVEAALRD